MLKVGPPTPDGPGSCVSDGRVKTPGRNIKQEQCEMDFVGFQFESVKDGRLQSCRLHC